MADMCDICRRLTLHLDGFVTVYCPLCQKLPRQEEKKIDPVQEERDRLKRITQKFGFTKK